MSVNGIYRAGLTRRWHSNPDLCHVTDSVAEHSGRCARLLCALHPRPSAALLRAALTHDDGEAAPGPGDVSGPVKRAYPELSARLDKLEAAARVSLWGPDPDLTTEDRVWLAFVDRLDAYIVARHYAPHILDRDGWPEARVWLDDMAEVLGTCHGLV